MVPVNKWNFSGKTLVIILFLLLTSGVQASVEEKNNLKTVKTLVQNEQYAHAMVELNKLLTTQRKTPEIYTLAAKLLRETGQADQAEDMAKNALQLDYKYSRAYTELGYIFLQNNLAESFDHFFMASQYDPEDPMPHIGLAEAYRRNYQKDRAKDHILKAKELCFGRPEAYYAIGDYFYRINDYDKAEKYIRESIEAGRDGSFRAYYVLGSILEQRGAIQEAQQHYLAALKLRPDHPDAQKRLDSLIKVSYREKKDRKNTPKDLFEDIDPDLKMLMKADYYLMLDQFTEARGLYLKLLEKNPENPGAVAGLAQLHYSMWLAGYITDKNLTGDSIYILKAKPDRKNQIALLEFRMINRSEMPESIREKLINLSITESFDFYDLLNEVRAEFLLGNYEQSRRKLSNLLKMKLSNYEKFKILRHLCYDHNYYEALMVLQELKKTYYHNEEIEPAENRINAKLRDLKEEAVQASDTREYEEIIRDFPVFKPAYLYYAMLLEEMEDYKGALEKMKEYYRLYRLYPDRNPDITEEEIKEKINEYERKIQELAD